MYFQPVTVLQKMLSRFHTKNPDAKVKAPVLKSDTIVRLSCSGILYFAPEDEDVSELVMMYHVRRTFVSIIPAKMT